MKLRYKGLVNKTIAERRSLVKRLNQRLTQVEKTFGKDSEVYRGIVAPLMSDRFNKYLGTTKGTGRLKLKLNVSRDWNDEDALELVRIAQGSFETVTTFKRRAIERLKEEYGEDYTPTQREVVKEINTAKQFNDAMADFKEYMYDEYTIAERQEKFPELYRGENGLKPDYKLLQDILKKEANKKARWRKRFKNYKLVAKR